MSSIEEKVTERNKSKKSFTWEEVSIMCAMDDEKTKDKENRNYLLEENSMLNNELDAIHIWVRLNFGVVGEAHLDAFVKEVTKKENEFEDCLNENGNLRYTLHILKEKLKELGVDPDSLDPQIKEERDEA